MKLFEVNLIKQLTMNKYLLSLTAICYKMTSKYTLLQLPENRLFYRKVYMEIR